LPTAWRLPDPDDEHVVAAAVVTGAGVIVTRDSEDFPPERVPIEIEIQPPADFAHNTVAITPLLPSVPWKRPRPAVDGGGWR